VQCFVPARASLVAVIAATTATAAVAAAGSSQGPSSGAAPYLVRTQPGVVTKSILTTGDSVDGYRMAGIPDGLGAIDKESLAVRHGEDLIKRLYQPAGGVWQQIVAGSPRLALSRLCSADLPAQSAFYESASGLVSQERIFMDGEETGAEGRAIGTVVTGPDAGDAYVLPSLGRFSWENSVAKPDAGITTAVVGLDDSTPGQVYVYLCTKKATGTEVDKAGLTGGTCTASRLTAWPPRATPPPCRPMAPPSASSRSVTRV
jgi:hypothetical protein